MPRTRSRAWKRRVAKPDTIDPKDVFQKLQRRQLRDLETCRVVWERGGDPLAVCVAVIQSKLPEWLTNALLFLLTDGSSGERPPISKRWWRQRANDALDAIRAAEVAGVRTHPKEAQTWDVSYALADVFASEYGAPRGSASAVKRSYQRVSKGLADKERYYKAPAGTGQRIMKAMIYQRELLAAALERAKKE